MSSVLMRYRGELGNVAYLAYGGYSILYCIQYIYIVHSPLVGISGCDRSLEYHPSDGVASGKLSAMPFVSCVFYLAVPLVLTPGELVLLHALMLVTSTMACYSVAGYCCIENA